MFGWFESIEIIEFGDIDTSQVTDMSRMFRATSNLKPIFIGEKWVINESTDVTNMFAESKTTSVEELCEPNSTEEWCVVN